MGTSPDVGGRQGLGRPLVPEYHEQEATAQTQVAKQGLAIMPSTIEVVFTQLGGNVWKYDANASKPKLPMNVLTAVTHPDPKMGNPEIQKQYEELVNQLPLNLQNELKRNRRLPFSERNPHYAIFDMILKMAAEALIWMQECTERTTDGHEEEISKAYLAPFNLIAMWASNAGDTLASLKRLADQGVIERGAYNDTKAAIKPFVNRVRELLGLGGREFLMTLGRLSIEANEMVKRYDTNKLGNTLPLAGSLLHTLTPLLYALQSPGKEVLMTSLSLLYDIPIGKKEGGGYVGPRYEEVVDKVASSLPDLSDRQQFYLKFITRAFLGLYTSWITTFSGMASPRAKTTKDHTEEIHSLAFMLASTLVTSCEALKAALDTAFEWINLNQDHGQTLRAGVEALIMSCLITSGMKGNKTVMSGAPLLKGAQKALHRTIKAVADGINSDGGDKDNTKLAAALRHGLLAVKNNDAKGYGESLQAALKSHTITWNEWQYESEMVLNVVVRTLQMIFISSQQEEFTKIIRQPA